MGYGAPVAEAKPEPVPGPDADAETDPEPDADVERDPEAVEEPDEDAVAIGSSNKLGSRHVSIWERFDLQTVLPALLHVLAYASKAA